MKVCNNENCKFKGELQPFDNFYWRNDRNTYENQCKTCRGEQRKERYKKNPEVENERNKKRYNENSEAVIKRTVQWGKDNIERRREITRNSERRRRWKKRWILLMSLILFNKNKEQNARNSKKYS